MGSRYLVLSPLPLQLHPIRKQNNSIKKPTFDLRAFGKYLYIAQRQIYKIQKTSTDHLVCIDSRLLFS